MISLTSPIETRAHSWSAGLKLTVLCLSTVFLYSIDNLYIEIAFLVIVITLYALPGNIFLRFGLSKLRILWPFILVVLLWHWWISELLLGTSIIIRMIAAFALANLVTMTTKLSDMIDVVHFLARPLERFGLNPRILELAIALVIRMTPVLLHKGQGLTLAWRARSRRRPGWRIILPFTLLALDDADHVAEALKARGGLTNLEKK
ncbi:MAG: energy-coupling factor transporter transmembrane protein EcfT [Oceanospirillaceae bacterium]|nr:energy-coupling factor transporter transmembrane protein EcfT [Oceanospirillaceae bacterium]